MNPSQYRHLAARQRAASWTYAEEAEARKPRPWSVIYSLSFAGGLALLILPVGSLTTMFSSAVVVWGTALMLLALGLHGYFECKRRGENPWLAPRSLLMLFFFFEFGVGSLTVYYWDRLPWTAVPWLRDRFVAYGVRANLENACHLAALGGLGLFIGLSLPVDRFVRALPGARWTMDVPRFKRNLMFYAPAALILSIVVPPLLPISIQATVTTFFAVGSVMIAVASGWLFTATTSAERGKWAVFLVVAVGLAWVGGFQSGMIGGFAYPLGAALWGYVIVKRKLPWKFLLPTLALLFFFVFPWMTLYKYAAPPGSATISERVDMTKERMEFMDYRAAMELTADRFIARSSGMALLPVFTEFYPKVYAFVHGQSFLAELTAFVPRILWPNKLALSETLNQYTMGVGMVAQDNTTSAVFDCVSEYYINFGLWGVFLLCILHGAYEKTLYAWLTTKTDYLIGSSIYAYFFIINHTIFGFFYTFNWHSRQIPAWLLVFYLLSRATPALARRVRRGSPRGIGVQRRSPARVPVA